MSWRKRETRGLWREVSGVEEVTRGIVAEREARAELERSLKRCKVCGGRARIKEFGRRRTGVWVGCDRTSDCCRYIELHTEGWSVDECVAEWNWYNSGLIGIIRRMKYYFYKRIGKGRAIKRRIERDRRKKEREETRRRREAFGIKESGDRKSLKDWLYGKIKKQEG